MVGIYTNQSLNDVERRRLVFEGALILVGRSRATEALCNHTISMIEEALGPAVPELAQFEMPVEEFVRRVGPLKTRFTNDAGTKDLVRSVLEDAGCDLGDTYFDVPRLRVVPSGEYLSSGVSYAYKAHRDIWYSSPVAQVNWWMPVYPVTPSRAMSFFPAYWDRAVDNSSGEFDYGEWCAVGRRMATTQIKQDTRKHPLPKQPVETTSELRIAGSTGDPVLFSAAQLHATAANTSGRTRFSIDFRTVALSDLRSGAGAPNIDSRAQGSTLGDFISALDFKPIEDSSIVGVPHVKG